jgi:cbb3-type cytochrome oxidase maturation protein
MTVILYLLLVSLGIAACGLGFFLWSLRSGQYDDLDGAASRILFDGEETMQEPITAGCSRDAAGSPAPTEA